MGRFWNIDLQVSPVPETSVWPGLGTHAPGGGTVERPYSQLLIALRAELGEMGGRFHFHYLLGGTWTRNAITLAHQLEHRWFGLFGQGAIAKCRAYDRSRAGVEYVTKCLNQGLWGANEYELRKYNLADTVTLSRSVVLVIEDLERMGTDARRARVTNQVTMRWPP